MAFFKKKNEPILPESMRRGAKKPKAPSTMISLDPPKDEETEDNEGDKGASAKKRPATAHVSENKGMRAVSARELLGADYQKLLDSRKEEAATPAAPPAAGAAAIRVYGTGAKKDQPSPSRPALPSVGAPGSETKSAIFETVSFDDEEQTLERLPEPAGQTPQTLLPAGPDTEEPEGWENAGQTLNPVEPAPVVRQRAPAVGGGRAAPPTAPQIPNPSDLSAEELAEVLNVPRVGPVRGYEDEFADEIEELRHEHDAAADEDELNDEDVADLMVDAPAPSRRPARAPRPAPKRPAAAPVEDDDLDLGNIDEWEEKVEPDNES